MALQERKKIFGRLLVYVNSDEGNAYDKSGRVEGLNISLALDEI